MIERAELLKLIEAERLRHKDLPGSEWDHNNTPNDWVAIVSHYVANDVRRNGSIPSSEDYKASLIKSAAIILAALEHIEIMKERKELH